MKTYSIFLIGAVILTFLSCEKLEDETLIPLPKPNEVDSTIYQIYITVEDDQIVEMNKFHDDSLVEKIALEYYDSIIQKTIYYFDTLMQKSVYHLNDLNYAEYSSDSFFSLNRFYMTFYTYSEQGYLIEEKHIPGYNYAGEVVEYNSTSYNILNGNSYTDRVLIRPPGTVSTGCFTFKYTKLLQTYDITSYNNSFLGNPNHNLPESYGYQFLYKFGAYHKEVSYEYEMTGNLVSKRIGDNYKLFENDSILHRDILYYHYN